MTNGCTPMNKSLEMGQTSAAGSLRLFVGKILSTFILAFGTILLTILISEGDYGLYAIALVPANTMLLFQDWGVGAAMTKRCASMRATNKEGDLRKIILSGLAFEAITGLLLTLFSLTIANFVASSIFNKPGSAFLITILCFSIFFNSLLAASQSVLVGFERMGYYSILMICQAVAQGVLSPALVFLGYGATGAALGFTVSSMIVGILAVSVLHFSILRKLGSDELGKSNLFKTLKPLIRFGVPFALANLIVGITSQFYWYVLGPSVDAVLLGNLKVAGNFAVLLTFVTVPISTVLFPAFSKIDPKNEGQLLKKVFGSSVKYTALLLVPATMALIVLSEPFIGTIYGGKWLDASFFLSLIVLNNFAVIFGTLSNNSLLIGMGKTWLLMKLNGLVLAIAVPFSLLLIPLLGIPGLIFVTIVANVPSWFIGLRWTWDCYRARANFGSSAKIVFSSVVAAGSTFLLLSLLNSADWIRFVAGLGLFVSVYLVVTPLVGGISQSDINNLRAMFSGLGPFSRLLEVPLRSFDLILKKITKRDGTVESLKDDMLNIE
jgi:O-antigen/teichoic acid export membrane protein